MFESGGARFWYGSWKSEARGERFRKTTLLINPFFENIFKKFDLGYFLGLQVTYFLLELRFPFRFLTSRTQERFLKLCHEDHHLSPVSVCS